jgi:hypothetical protein
MGLGTGVRALRDWGFAVKIRAHVPACCAHQFDQPLPHRHAWAAGHGVCPQRGVFV